jgi:hypothetical protein
MRLPQSGIGRLDCWLGVDLVAVERDGSAGWTRHVSRRGSSNRAWLHRPLADRHRIDELALPWGSRLPHRCRIARPVRRQRRSSPPSAPTAPHEQAQVDGLMGDPHARVIGIGHPQPARDLLRRPAQPPNLSSTSARSRGSTASLDGLGRAARRSHQRAGPNSMAAAMVGQLPRHRRRCPAQPAGDRPAGVAAGHSSADLLTFDRRQRAGWPLSRRLLDTAGLQHRTEGPRLPSRRAIGRSDSPCRYRRQSSSCSWTDSPHDRTRHLHRRRTRQCGSDAITH